MRPVWLRVCEEARDECLCDCAIVDPRSGDIRSVRSPVYGRIQNYNGRVLVADERPVVLEGAWDGNKVVVVSFPDEASFRDWAESQEYLEIAMDRKAGARSVILLVKGVPSRTEVVKTA